MGESELIEKELRKAWIVLILLAMLNLEKPL
jgi:hypothetical protein